MNSNFFSFMFGVAAMISIVAPFYRFYFPGFIGIVIIIVILLSVVAFQTNPVFFSQRNLKNAFAFIFAWFSIYFISLVVNYALVPLIFWVYAIYGFLFILLKNELKIKAFNYFIRCLSILLLLSIIEYLINFLTGFAVSSTIVYRGNGMVFNNLIFNLIKIDTIPRFQSIADEPGLIGTLCGMLIYVLNDTKKYSFELIIIWFAGLLSFSLAFYILAVIRLISSKLNFKVYLLLALISFSLSYVLKDHVETNIKKRLQSESIDNRTTASLDKALTTLFDSSTIIWGLGYNAHNRFSEGTAEDGGAGAKVFLLSYGLIGIFLVVIIYSKILLNNKRINNLNTLIFLLIFWLSFYQRQTIDRPYVIIVFFSYGICNLISTNKNRLCQN